MGKKLKISKVLTSVFLLVVMLMPTLIQFSHTFDYHKHITFSEDFDDVHLESVDCSICDFEFFAFNSTISIFIEQIKTVISSKEKISFISLFTNAFANNNNLLRGPPSFLLN